MTPTPAAAAALPVLSWGRVALAGRYLLARLAGNRTPAFRMAVRELGGVALATTDLVNARALRQPSRRTMELSQTCPEHRPLAVQIYGSDAGEMAHAARWLQDYGVTS